MRLEARLRRLERLRLAEVPPSWWDALVIAENDQGCRPSLEEMNATCPVEFVIWRAGLGEDVSLEEAQRRIAAGERCPPARSGSQSRGWRLGCGRWNG